MTQSRILGGAALTAVVLVALPARAGDPTSSDCLRASENEIQSRGAHRLREAREQALLCASASCPADVRTECERRIRMLNEAIPTVVFDVRDRDKSDLTDVKIFVDDKLLADRLDGTALSFDPGEHVFRFESAGRGTAQRKLVLREGEKNRRETIVLEGGALAPIPSAPTPSPHPAPAPERGLGTQRTIAVVTGAVGLIGLGVGAVFGAIAASKKSDAEAACPDRCATQEGVDKWSEAKSAGNGATVGFVAGGVVLAAAAVLWFTAPTPRGAPTARVGVGPGSIGVEGRW